MLRIRSLAPVSVLALLFALAACGKDSPPTNEPPDAGPIDTPVVCGNQEMEAGEDCDDGDTIVDIVCDSMCHHTCGNGTVDSEVGELCDPGITTGEGACPAGCDDGDACTADVSSGSDCTLECVHSPITATANGDGCCPAGATANEDSDCVAACGNGTVEPGELCDTAITSGPGLCPAACNDGQSCTTDALIMGGTCQAACTATPIDTPINGDGCCPLGANSTTDNDCPAGCGNGVFEPPGEACDTAIPSGPGSCPTACNDGNVCTADVLANAGTCGAACVTSPITMPTNGDGCCPPGANANNDNDCSPVCGNGVPEPGEACDDGNGNENDQCTSACAVPVVAFRFSDLDLRDPHIFVKAVFCFDVTDTEVAGFAVNKELQKGVQTDDDGDGDLDLSPTLVFRNYSQTAPTQPVELYLADCAPPLETTSCTPGDDPANMGTATNLTMGQCLTYLPGTVFGYTPPVTPSAASCFVTSPMTVNLSLGGIPITLHDARIAAGYVGNPANTMVNGLLMGFISETDANNTIIPTTFPLVGGQPLSLLLPGGDPPPAGGGNCSTHSDKDTNNGVAGWWFYLNFPASRVPWSEP